MSNYCSGYLFFGYDFGNSRYWKMGDDSFHDTVSALRRLELENDSLICVTRSGYLDIEDCRVFVAIRDSVIDFEGEFAIFPQISDPDPAWQGILDEWFARHGIPQPPEPARYMLGFYYG